VNKVKKKSKKKTNLDFEEVEKKEKKK